MHFLLLSRKVQQEFAMRFIRRLCLWYGPVLTEPLNQQQSADDDICVCLSQVMNASVKNRALAQESSWAFSHVAADKKQFLWVV